MHPGGAFLVLPNLDIRTLVEIDGAFTKDRQACQVWYKQHRRALAERYPNRFVMVVNNGVIAAEETALRARWKHALLLLKCKEPFFAFLGYPSGTVNRTRVA